MTLAGAPSVPGAHAYADVYPLKLEARLQPAVLTVTPPLAAGNIAVFANRRSLIETDTLPDYLAFVPEHQAEARAILETQVYRRASAQRPALPAMTPFDPWADATVMTVSAAGCTVSDTVICEYAHRYQHSGQPPHFRFSG